MRIFQGYISDSERLRKVIKSYILNNPKITRRIEKEKITRFFDYCINCERELDNTARKNHHFHKNIEVFELRFCCSCHKLFKDKSFEEFPASLFNKIKQKIKTYKKEMKFK